MKNQTSTFKKGFTLIELLVVITIIGILSSVILVAVSKVRSRVRDTQRMQNLKALKRAFDTYYLVNGTVPCKSWISVTIYLGEKTNPTSCLSVLVPEYISKIPFDPVFGMDDVEGNNDQSVFVSPNNEYVVRGYLDNPGPYISKKGRPDGKFMNCYPEGTELSTGWYDDDLVFYHDKNCTIVAIYFSLDII